jgi:tRNA (cmo5U34)-methyltransferase
MNRELDQKSTIGQIRERFDNDVERFSKLETGQQATIDAPLVLEIVAQTAATHLQPQGRLLDLGCGAGNFTLSVLSRVTPLDCTLVDLSRPMLERAHARVGAANSGKIETVQADMRDLAFGHNSFDTILAGAVLHHLRHDRDWREMFQRLYQWLRPGGLLFVADLVVFDDPAVHALMWQRYGDYLQSLGGAEYRQKVFDYIKQEDSPRSLKFQMQLLRESGFQNHDILHRNSVFATFYARKLPAGQSL